MWRECREHSFWAAVASRVATIVALRDNHFVAQHHPAGWVHAGASVACLSPRSRDGTEANTWEQWLQNTPAEPRMRRPGWLAFALHVLLNLLNSSS